MVVDCIDHDCVLALFHSLTPLYLLYSMRDALALIVFLFILMRLLTPYPSPFFSLYLSPPRLTITTPFCSLFPSFLFYCKRFFSLSYFYGYGCVLGASYLFLEYRGSHYSFFFLFFFFTTVLSWVKGVGTVTLGHIVLVG